MILVARLGHHEKKLVWSQNQQYGTVQKDNWTPGYLVGKA